MCIPLLYPLQLQCSYDYLAEEFGAEISLTFCEEAVQNPMMAQALHLLKDIDGLNVRIFFTNMAYLYLHTYYNCDTHGHFIMAVLCISPACIFISIVCQAVL